MIAQFIIQVLLLPLVLGDGDQAVGFRKAMAFFSIIGTVLFVIALLTTKERVVPTPQQKSTVRQGLEMGV